ncbi:hypothetical protein PoB_001077000 [Plakobranchus ocellatus]|uniref:Uncharacterized protein n=1 Tax=Plakobranchus ocellatus TaxID=259542 RepID=A0AAV3YP71_9GAST|nr:hypothetical protein PoB_001077000 [Plakobranchus ocellatus]
MCTQGVELSTRERQLGKTSKYAQKTCNSQHGIGKSARLRNVHTRCPTLNTEKAVLQDFRMCTQEVHSQHGRGNLARLPNVHTKCPTLHTGYAILQVFRMCTKEAPLNTGLRFEKASECAHQRSNSQHVIGNFARHPNVHTRGPTLNKL